MSPLKSIDDHKTGWFVACYQNLILTIDKLCK